MIKILLHDFPYAKTFLIPGEEGVFRFNLNDQHTINVGGQTLVSVIKIGDKKPFWLNWNTEIEPADTNDRKLVDVVTKVLLNNMSG